MAASLSLDQIGNAISAADNSALDGTLSSDQRSKFQQSAQLLRGDLVKLIGQTFDETSAAYQQATAAITAANTAMSNASADINNVITQLAALGQLLQALANILALVGPLV